MKLRHLLIAACAMTTSTASAQKALYIPNEWKAQRTDTLLYKETDTENKYTWSKSRSKESDNFIVYWDKYYGNTIPTNAPSTYKVDVDDLLKKAEFFYSLNIGKLAFCDENNSKVSKYKMMILLNHTTDWVCYGGGYDDMIGALWLSPNTCKPVGHSVAHEVGHSFQYQCFADLKGYAGFRTAIGNGAAFWEQTAQWQAAQAYPELKWSQSWSLYSPYANCAMTHEWMRYQSYWWHYFLVEKYGIDAVGRLWRHDTGKGQDPNEVLMDMLGIDCTELFKLYFEYALKMTTVDLDAARDEAAPYIGDYPFRYYSIGDNTFQVAYYSCPQSTGFNVIPLNVPAEGGEVSVQFTSLKTRASLAEGDGGEYLKDGVVTKIGKTTYNYNSSYNAQRAFRLGYVALMKDGTRQYIYEDSLYCAQGGMTSRSVDVKADIPEGVDRLWFVVVPAPKSYIQHKWDEDFSNDDQWPYTVKFSNTNIYGAPTISDDLPISDATITYDVTLPYSSAGYDFTPVKIEGQAAAVAGTALQMPVSELANHIVAWSSAAPADGQMKFYSVNPADGTCTNQGSTANGYGHWFDASGKIIGYGVSSYAYSEFSPSTLTFNVGQYPGRLKVGTTYTISQALKYKRGDETAVVRFIFNVKCVKAGEAAGYTVSSIKQSDVVTGVQSHAAISSEQPKYISTSGIRTLVPTKGIHVVTNAKGQNIKVLSK